MADTENDTVKIRDEFGFEQEVPKSALKFFPNVQVLDKSGRVNTQATNAANKEK